MCVTLVPGKEPTYQEGCPLEYESMRCFSAAKVAILVRIVALVTSAHCCQCGASHKFGTIPRELAKMRAEGATTIFEGTAERLDLRWSLLDAKEGAVVPADSLDQLWNDGSGPHTVVTFQVKRVYKGQLGSEVRVRTGLGGGDCAARFTPGFTYLVYLYGTNASECSVGMCSPGGWIESSAIGADLRYLRGESPMPDDLVPFQLESLLNAKEVAAKRQQDRRRYEEFQKKLASVTGRICGSVIRVHPREMQRGIVAFLSTLGYLPEEFPYAEVKDDGSFCSGPLASGKYYLRFTSGSGEQKTSNLYYPGVSERSNATPIDVTGGQTRSDVIFNVSPQKTYSVRGFLSTSGKPDASARSAVITLFKINDDPLLQSYRKEIDLRSALPLVKIKFFDIENVLPGRYVAYVSGPGQGWFTKKVELTVSTHSKIIWLDLIQKK
jgi:hypothetical protein